MDERDRCCVSAPVESEVGGEMDKEGMAPTESSSTGSAMAPGSLFHFPCHSLAFQAS